MRNFFALNYFAVVKLGFGKFNYWQFTFIGRAVGGFGYVNKTAVYFGFVFISSARKKRESNYW